MVYAFNGTPSVKDAIEAIGVPHTEVDLVLVDGESVDFAEGSPSASASRCLVFDVLGYLTGRAPARAPLRLTRSVLDVHLGKLARYLRLLGFDTRYQNDYDDDTIIGLARDESRVILTRDRLLKHGAVAHGYWVRATTRASSSPKSFACSISAAHAPVHALHPLQRRAATGPKSAVAERLPPRVRAHFESSAMPEVCGRVLARLSFDKCEGWSTGWMPDRGRARRLCMPRETGNPAATASDRPPLRRSG